MYKVGPVTSYKWDYNPYKQGEITPVTQVFSAIYKGPIIPLITGSGAHLVGSFGKRTFLFSIMLIV